MKIRKLVTVVEEIQEDGGRRLEKPLRKVAAVAVIENPFAGRYVEDLQDLIKTGEELGDLRGRRAVMERGGADRIGLHHLAQIDQIGEVARAAMMLAQIEEDAFIALARQEFLVGLHHRAVGREIGRTRELGDRG